MIEWYKTAVFENYANFSGRARRKEYWYFTLVNLLILLFIYVLGSAFSEGGSEDPDDVYLIVLMVYFIGTILPNIAVTVRRLHDTNKSGWYYFVNFIPYAGSIWMLVLTVSEGTKGTNKYGPDPKRPFDEIDEIGKVESE